MMFDDILEMQAVEIREQLVELEAERAFARSNGFAELLEVEIAATRELYVASVVTEIGTLRGELFGRQVG